LADAHDDKTRHIEPGRRDEVERRPVFALESVGHRRPSHQIAGRPERTARGGPEFHPLLTEQDNNALSGRGKGSKFKLQAAGHEALPSRFGAKWKPVLRMQSSLPRLRELIGEYARQDVTWAGFAPRLQR